MASGEKKYGLIDPKKKLSVADVFNNDSDSGDEREIMKKRLQKDAEKGAKKQTIIDINRALEQDPTVYQYDEVYETIKKPEKEASKATVVRKVKYMDALLKTADKRKKENERRTERLVQKEREAEGDEFKDKEEFITSSYRQKLEEMKKAEEEEKKMEYIESIMDVTKQQDLGSFYRQLYKETVPDNESKVAEKTDEPVNEDKPDVTEKAASSSSSSGSDSSSDSSSSTSDSSSEDEPPKVEQIESTAEKAETADNQVPAVPEPEAVKTSESDAKFNNTKKRDRTYRQRESSPKRAEREPTKPQNSSSYRKLDDNRSRRDDRGREYGRGHERDRDRVRSRRDEPRPSRNTDRYRNDSRRQRSRSRTNRGKDGSRNAYNTDRRRPRTPNKEKKSEKVSGEPSEKRKTDKKENVKPENGNVESSEKEEKIDIWKKRTVGVVFDAALERYFQRKAARGS